jgi:hypothetical protein
MRVVSKIDEQGFFLEDVLLDNDAPLPSSEHVESRPPQGFHKPKWDGTSWVEGKPEGEILEDLKVAQIQDFHNRAITDLEEALPEGRDELQAIHNATLIAVCERLGVPVDARMSAVDAVQRKAFAKKAQIEAAQSSEELEGISWT